ncbi:MAG: class I SAM-dependent methyltransferase [Gemmatimonadota bacterium]
MICPERPGLEEQFGAIDVYVFDQLLRGRITPDMRVLDAGCGQGRNLVYLLRSGADVCAVDSDPVAIEHVRALAATLSPDLPADRFRAESLMELSFPDATFDVILCNAVLHFLEDETEFQAILDQMFRVLRPGGLFFARLSSTIGVEHLLKHEGGRRYELPGGRHWFLVDEAFLDSEVRRLGAEPLDPLKTTVVQNQRSMTTWVLRKA